MRIAHINNTSGIASIIAEYQHKQGNVVDVFVFNKIIFNQFGGTMINYWSPISRWKLFKKLEKDYDVWHYHYPYGSLKKRLEKRNLHKTYVKHYHGNDIRGKYDGDFCLVSTPDLLKYAPNGKWIPTPIDMSEIEEIAAAPSEKEDGSETKIEEKKRLRVAHYPYYKNYTSPYNEHYSNALYDLEKENRCEKVEIFSLSHVQALHQILTVDIVVGKIMPEVGWFGKFELEGMSLGKPVITFVSDDLYEKYRPPVYRTTTQTFKQDLISLIEDANERKRLAKEGRDYVRRYHSIKDTVSTVNECYKK
jgi:glycosyltransferase involved in cell wall biosynthesis